MSEVDESQPLDELSSSVQKVQTLLKTKDDTSRFVGLALLKSVLDNAQALRTDEAAIFALWESVPPKFLDRLLRTSQGVGSQKHAKDMLDLAVSVIHTFTALIPPEKRDEKLAGRIPRLVACLVQSSNETAKLVLEILVSLASQPSGAKVLAHIEDLSPLTELAPSEPLVLDILSYAWLNALVVAEDKQGLRSRIDKTVEKLVASFKGTDAVTLLEFIASLLRSLQTPILLDKPHWLEPVVDFIRNLVTNRPTAASRSAYTNLSAALLELYPGPAAQLLFSSNSAKADKPFSYLLINLLLVDLRSSFPALLEQLNSPSYAAISRRLASAFDVISNFVGFLLRSMEDESSGFVMMPDLLLKLRKAIAETMSVTIEYLRDRWDASVAGAMGLHPDARAGTANTSAGSHLTLAWDSKSENVSEDPLVLAAIRTLAIWLREDDNEVLRAEATGLTDMFVELYRSSSVEKLDMRRAILVAFEGTTTSEDGVAALLEHDGWAVLTSDLLSILQSSSTTVDEVAAARGIEIVRVLLPIVEAEQPGPRPAWLDVVTGIAAWGVPDAEQPGGVREFQVAALQLVVALLVGAHPLDRKRYMHSIAAVIGVASQLKQKLSGDAPLREDLDDVLEALGSLT
ncbi:DUF1941-domain-containing protein [Thozetella sp. PMI_491]|nr:DUF1941-domain-containing protein [Thozetella sp. PMI_491]